MRENRCGPGLRSCYKLCEAHVQENTDCQSGRDCVPRYPHGAQDGHRRGRGIFRGRQGCAPRGARRRGGVHRRPAFARVLSRNGQDRRGLPADRCRSAPSGLRVSVRECGLPQAPGPGGYRLHRPDRGGDRVDGRQDCLEEAGARRRCERYSRPQRRNRERDPGGKNRARGRLPGDDQGERGRRRQGAAGRGERRGVPRGLRHLLQRSVERVRRRPRIHREIHLGTAPCRDSGAGRRPWPRGAPGRARMFDPAPPPEARRGGAVAVSRRGHAQGHGRASGGPGKGGALPVGGHGGVRGRRRPALLFPGDEHPPPGGTSRDRDGDWVGPRRADDPHRGG